MEKLHGEFFGGGLTSAFVVTGLDRTAPKSQIGVLILTAQTVTPQYAGMNMQVCAKIRGIVSTIVIRYVHVIRQGVS